MKMGRFRLTKIALALFLLGPSAVSSSKRIRKNNDPDARRFRVRNHSSSSLLVFWMNLESEERLLQFELAPGSSDTLNSHVAHEFEIREKANKRGECKGKRKKCRRRFFQITEYEDQVFTVDKEFKVDLSSSRTRAEAEAKEALKECRAFQLYLDEKSTSTLEVLDKLAECMTQNVQKSLHKVQEEIDFQATIRRRLGSRLKDYACGDPEFPTTQPLNVKEWNPNNPRLRMDDESHTVSVLLQSDTTLIATIENMAAPADCDFVRNATGSYFEQEGLPQVPWEARTNPAALRFLTKIYAYADPAVKMMNLYARLPRKGEVLFEMHQDSAALPRQANRHFISEWPVDEPNFARLLMFCEVPEKGGGGAIHFPESGVHVNPKLGEGLLITYTKQSTTNQSFLESFSNEHFDCPILDGNLTVVHHQFRLFPNM